MSSPVTSRTAPVRLIKPVPELTASHGARSTEHRFSLSRLSSAHLSTAEMRRLRIHAFSARVAKVEIGGQRCPCRVAAASWRWSVGASSKTTAPHRHATTAHRLAMAHHRFATASHHLAIEASCAAMASHRLAMTAHRPAMTPSCASMAAHRLAIAPHRASMAHATP